jgi:hypothetical protein
MTTNNPLFGRQWKISVYLDNGQILEVSNSDYEVQSGALRCTFNIDRPGYQAYYYGDIVIYNLNGPTESQIIKESNRVVVEAGYVNGAYGKIFDGRIFQIFRERENVVDYKLTLHCLDGMGIMDSTLCAFTLFAGSDQRGHIKSIAEQATNPIQLGVISENINTRALPRGKTFFGQPKDYLRQIAGDNNAQFYVQDQQIHITRVSDGTVLTANEAIVFTPNTGLIGTPQVTSEGISFKVLLNPLLKITNPSMVVKLDMTAVQQQLLKIGQYPTILDQSGFYQIGKLRHFGDTRGNDWYTEVVGMNSLGVLPTLVQTAQMSPN